MSNQEEPEDISNDTITYVYLPDEQLNGFLIKEGAYYSTVQYFDNGVGYIIEVSNDEFIVVDEIGFGHIEEQDKNL